MLKFPLLVVCQEHELTAVQDKLSLMVSQYKLPLEITWLGLTKLSNKYLKTLDMQQATIIVQLDKQGNLIACIYQQSIIAEGQKNTKQQLIKASLDWHKLQRRIVTAGRKSELILQACKLTADSIVIDATAGFGHDSLIMASSGAKVVMLENNPLIALLLVLERQRMQSESNWHGLMSRLTICYADFLHDINLLQATAVNYSMTSLLDEKVDVVYLDPMFPNASYEGAKVGKGMQTLHQLAEPPSHDEESLLLAHANAKLNKQGRIVVKRPRNAPYLATLAPTESWNNDAIRFDGYLQSTTQLPSDIVK